jgi:hypothetical protein
MSAEAREVGGPNARTSRTAFRFVLLIGILSFFADFTYEGARSVLGPYLAVLGASATVVGVPSPPAHEGRPNRLVPSMLASFPASTLNQKPSDLGILNRFKLDPSRSSPIFQVLSYAR